ncbi:hypothetical protein BDV26DRAFT_260354 [Aspergillus bertholletiae]|uniref:F-box domain-containing protein n=1 Tax=Aspergillus bertholletiae TaxID=1226010 RepID=A0A5N7BB33_9EURO|nr:hypothetical protein BDV26DRAFT_260354 [Aspergillus bertholletiae]
MDRLPAEILLRIFSYLLPNLSPVLRVNSRWFDCGASLLWREAFWFHLSRMPKDRRMVYAAAIGGLFLSETAKEQVEEFSHLAYPRLKHLHIDSDPKAKVKVEWLKRYMHAGLQAIEFGGDFHPELLLHLQNNCHQLRKISISNPSERLTLDIFLNFLQNSSVTKLSLDGSHVHTLLWNPDALDHLANRGNLEELSFGYTIERLPEGIQALPLIQSVRKLSVSVMHDVFPFVISSFPSLHDLELNLEGGRKRAVNKMNGSDLKPLSRLTQLRCLDISIDGVMNFGSDDLAFLKGLKHLTKLSLTGREKTGVTAAGFKHTDLEDLLAHLPNLQALTFHMYRLDLTSETLAAIGQSCPLLSYVNLTGGFNILQLKTCQVPLFPRTRSISLNYFTSLVIDPTSGTPHIKEGFQ